MKNGFFYGIGQTLLETHSIWLTDGIWVKYWVKYCFHVSKLQETFFMQHEIFHRILKSECAQWNIWCVCTRGK